MALFFYRSVWAFLALSPVIVLFWKQKKKELADRRKQQLAIEFKELLLGVAAALKGGYALENAFLEAGGEVAALFGKESLMAVEMELLAKRMQNRIPLENGLTDLGARSGVEEIRDFAEILSIARHAGGSLDSMIHRTAGMIAGRLEVKREIRGYIAARQFELKIMNLVPFGIVGYVSLASPGYFSVLYHNAAGVLVMSGALAGYVTAYLAGKRLVDIEV